MTLQPHQLDELIESYCNRVVDEMSIKEMERMLYDLLVDSFSQSSENDMQALITAIYGDDYYNQLVEEVTTEVEE